MGLVGSGGFVMDPDLRGNGNRGGVCLRLMQLWSWGLRPLGKVALFEMRFVDKTGFALADAWEMMGYSLVAISLEHYKKSEAMPNE